MGWSQNSSTGYDHLRHLRAVPRKLAVGILSRRHGVNGIETDEDHLRERELGHRSWIPLRWVGRPLHARQTQRERTIERGKKRLWPRHRIDGVRLRLRTQKDHECRGRPRAGHRLG